MEYKNYIDKERFEKLQKEVYDNAKKHGWHEKQLSQKHLLGMIMTEMCEAVEADRKGGRRADLKKFEHEATLIKEWNDVSDEYKNSMWKNAFETHIKDTVEDELADVVIRIFDMAGTLYEDNMVWENKRTWDFSFREDLNFVENAYFFVVSVLSSTVDGISGSVSYIFDWADHMKIDLWKHIELKMRYNEMRPYKHGGKKY